MDNERWSHLVDSDKSVKAELRVGSRTCQCTVCDLFFTGEASFDRHLSGQDEGNSDCRSPLQMLAIGMTQNVHGVWQFGKSKKQLEREAEEAA